MAERGPEGSRQVESPARETDNKKRMVSELKNLYWQLRSLRKHHKTERRLLYRRIKATREKIILQGADEEEIRLLCRYLANMRNKHGERAYLAYRAQLKLPF